MQGMPSSSLTQALIESRKGAAFPFAAFFCDQPSPTQASARLHLWRPAWHGMAWLESNVDVLRIQEVGIVCPLPLLDVTSGDHLTQAVKMQRERTSLLYCVLLRFSGPRVVLPAHRRASRTAPGCLSIWLHSSRLITSKIASNPYSPNHGEVANQGELCNCFDH